jgi:hypothetical protein
MSKLEPNEQTFKASGPERPGHISLHRQLTTAVLLSGPEDSSSLSDDDLMRIGRVVFETLDSIIVTYQVQVLL